MKTHQLTTLGEKPLWSQTIGELLHRYQRGQLRPVKPLPSASFGTAPSVSTLTNVNTYAPDSAIGGYNPFQNIHPLTNTARRRKRNQHSTTSSANWNTSLQVKTQGPYANEKLRSAPNYNYYNNHGLKAIKRITSFRNSRTVVYYGKVLLMKYKPLGHKMDR